MKNYQVCKELTNLPSVFAAVSSTCISLFLSSFHSNFLLTSLLLVSTALLFSPTSFLLVFASLFLVAASFLPVFAPLLLVLTSLHLVLVSFLSELTSFLNVLSSLLLLPTSLPTSLLLLPICLGILLKKIHHKVVKFLFQNRLIFNIEFTFNYRIQNCQSVFVMATLNDYSDALA